MPKTLFDKFLDTLFPNVTCLLCSDELKGGERFLLCNACESQLPHIRDDAKICIKCGKPIYDEAVFCQACTGQRRNFICANSPLSYKGNAVKLVEGLKFYNKRYIAASFGAMLAEEYSRRKYSVDLIVAVPAYKGAESPKGYNQSALIARELSKIIGVEHAEGVLIKIRETRHQVELSGIERKKNLIGAFGVADRAKVRGKRILIVDDVITTGSTINECAAALNKAGAAEIYALSVCSTELKVVFGNAQSDG